MNVFMGTYEDVFTVADGMIGIDTAVVEDKPTSKRITDHCKSHSKPLIKMNQGEQINNISFKDKIKLVVVAGFGRILPGEFIEQAELILNFHPGIVQYCRGRHPLPCGILARHSMMGITCHIIDSEEVDAGPIVAQVRLVIDYNRDYWYNESRLRSVLPGLTRVVLQEYIDTGDVTMGPWDSKPDSYFPPLSEDTLHRILQVERLNDLLRGGVVG